MGCSHILSQIASQAGVWKDFLFPDRRGLWPLVYEQAQPRQAQLSPGFSLAVVAYKRFDKNLTSLNMDASAKFDTIRVQVHVLLLV